MSSFKVEKVMEPVYYFVFGTERIEYNGLYHELVDMQKSAWTEFYLINEKGLYNWIMSRLTKEEYDEVIECTVQTDPDTVKIYWDNQENFFDRLINEIYNARYYVYLRDFSYGGYSLYRMSVDPNNDNSCEQYVGNNKWNKISFLEAAEMELLSEISYEDALIIREKIDKTVKTELDKEDQEEYTEPP